MIIQKVRNDIKYQYNTETKLFLNPSSGKWVKNPRPSNISNDIVTITIPNECVKLIKSNISEPIAQESCMYLIEYIINKQDNFKRVYKSIDDKSRFKHKLDCTQRGVHIPSKQLRYLLTNNYLQYCEILVSLGIIEVQMMNYENTNTKYVYHYKYIHPSKVKTSQVLNFVYNRVQSFHNSDMSPWCRKLMNLTKKFNVQDVDLNNQSNYKIDVFGNRFHTPITNLKKCKRRLITLNGERCVEIDIVNSQPLILKYICDNPKKIKSICGEDISIQLSDSDYNFLNDLYSGGNKFYENLMNVCNYERRSTAKRTFMSIFGTNRPKLKKDVPVLDKIANQIQSRHIQNENICGTKNVPYKRMSYILQQVESYFVNNIRNELLKYGVVFTTVHDSFIVSESECEFTNQVINEIISKFNGSTKINR